jgi:hypothetical protein
VISEMREGFDTEGLYPDAEELSSEDEQAALGGTGSELVVWPWDIN